jgi:hypothetical protein
VRANSLNKPAARAEASRRNPEAGITIIEVVVGMLLLTVGLLAVAGSIAYAVTVSNKGRNVTNTKLLVVSILEQMETLRNTQTLAFGQIANAGQVDNTGAPTDFAGFPTGYQPISVNPGPDGIFGTTDDLINPGLDNVYGTGDDFTDPTWAVPNITRQITITSLSPNLKRIEVIIRYPDAGGQIRDQIGVSYLNNDARSNFR